MANNLNCVDNCISMLNSLQKNVKEIILENVKKNRGKALKILIETNKKLTDIEVELNKFVIQGCEELCAKRKIRVEDY